MPRQAPLDRADIRTGYYILWGRRRTVDWTLDGLFDISGCVELPGVGGMGHHYALPPFDGTATELDPEVLVYAPENGKLKLAAGEYIIPQPLWASAQPPSLFGQDFVKNDVLDIWALHVWLFRHNPEGIFEDWNPTVSCSN